MGGALDVANLSFNDFVVLGNLVQGPVKLVQFFLSLEHFLQLLVGLFLLGFVLLLKDLVLLFCLHSVSLHDVVVIVGLFISRLHLGKLVLHTVELHTFLLSLLLYLL